MNLYIVQSQDGKYFRSIGYGGYGSSWVDDLAKAKIYTKLGPARGRCTYWFREHPSFGCPKILTFTLNEKEATVTDMTEYATKAILKGKQKELKYKLARLQDRDRSFFDQKHRLEREHAQIQAELAALKK